MTSPETAGPRQAMDTTLPGTPVDGRIRFAMRGLRSVAYALFFAVCVSVAFEKPLGSSLVYSLCISLLCWFFIDGGRLAAARWVNRNDPACSGPMATRWPGWPWMMAIVPIGTSIGFSAGNEIANWLTGHHSPGIINSNARQAVALLFGAMIPGVIITYWFHSRETMAAQKTMLLTAQRQAAEHQLKLLESQLEPHMLFNTLANLRVLIAIDPPRAQAMLDQLIAFLRSTLSASRSASHPLSAEFSRLADYLALMQVRMGDRLQTHFDLPEALAGSPVPPLILQPLVENCIKHGLEPKVDGGRVDVGASREGRELVLRVRDSGVGLDHDAGDGTRFGLAQVRERLATLYGENASLTLAAVAGDGGTLATIRLPLTPGIAPGIAPRTAPGIAP